jgi:AbrB family transcriptional regulator, transcriptional pleiotropic regulator of transition state genes
MTSQVVKVQEKGQVTIPLEIRQMLGLKKGDLVTFIITEGGVVIKPAEVIVTEALEEINRVLKDEGISLEKLMAKGRELRDEKI